MEQLLSFDPIKFNVEDFKDLQETNYKLHPLADPEGGIWMYDKDEVIVSAVKKVVRELTSKAINGKFTNLFSIS